MTVDRGIKVGVVSSLAATILFIYFLDPLMRLVSRIVFGLSSSLTRAYVDGLYRDCALCTTVFPSAELHALVFGAFSGVLSGWLLSRATTKLWPSHVLPPDDPRTRSSRRLRRVATVVGVVSSLCLIVFIGLQVWATSFRLRTMTTFNQHLNAVGPFISEQEKLTLVSRWSQMRGAKDYEEISASISSVAKEHGVYLMPNPYF